MGSNKSIKYSGTIWSRINAVRLRLTYPLDGAWWPVGVTMCIGKRVVELFDTDMLIESINRRTADEVW